MKSRRKIRSRLNKKKQPIWGLNWNLPENFNPFDKEVSKSVVSIMEKLDLPKMLGHFNKAFTTEDIQVFNATILDDRITNKNPNFLDVLTEKSTEIDNYAMSLVKHGECETIEEALVESVRWHLRKAKGLEEPLKCPYHPGIIITVTPGVHKGTFIETHTVNRK